MPDGTKAGNLAIRKGPEWEPVIFWYNYADKDCDHYGDSLSVIFDRVHPFIFFRIILPDKGKEKPA